MNFKILFIGLGLFFLPFLSHAQVAKIVFTTEPQTVKPSEISGAITIQLQDSAGNSYQAPETIDIQFISASISGEFLSPSSENVVTKIISTGSANKNFRYRDSAEGNFTLTVNATGRTSHGIWSANQLISVSSSLPISTTTSTTTDSTATTTTTQTTSTNTTNTDNQTLSAHYGSAGLSIVEPISKFEIGAGRARLGVVDSPIEFRPEMKYSYNGNMTFKWSFGDGALGYGQVLSHSYAYPGDYVVVLNVSSPGGQAVSRVNVKVVPADISISLASSERVEVFNDSKNEINLFGRALSSQGRSFIFPEDTIIKAGQKISFASSITGLHPLDENNVSMIVVGDTLNKAFVPAVQIVENKKDNKQQIEILLSKAQEIQKQLATIPVESNFAVSPRSDQNIASAFVALDSFSSSTATTTKIAHWGWLQTIKEFFLGKKQ